jgi:protocatechuate 3,4-dioxygenase, beta subunit
MKHFITLFVVINLFTFCKAQKNPDSNRANRIVGGPCEGCEAIYEFGKSVLSPVDTLPGFHSTEPKLKVTGTIFQNDGKTPAKDVILYIYHTNQNGIYPKRGNESGWAARHGYLRGWVKTTDDGVYTFYTTKPGSYPSGSEPAHIHAIVKEPGVNEYYLDDYLFDNDPLLTQKVKDSRRQRGGSGIIKLVEEDDEFVVKRDIILGLNIPGYD